MDYYLKVPASGDEASPKREQHLVRASRRRTPTSKNVIEAIAQVNYERGNTIHVSETNNGNGNGVARVKLLVTKQDLKQILQLMNNNNGGGNTVCSITHSYGSSPEQRLDVLRRNKHVLRTFNAGKGNRRPRSWRPELQSIPEEL